MDLLSHMVVWLGHSCPRLLTLTCMQANLLFVMVTARAFAGSLAACRTRVSDPHKPGPHGMFIRHRQDLQRSATLLT